MDVWIPFPGDRVDHTPGGCGGAVTVTAADGPVREAEAILGGQR